MRLQDNSKKNHKYLQKPPTYLNKKKLPPFIS